jgi:HNH endonuclease
MARQEFKADDVEELVVQCHRRCCVCHKYCGVKIEIDHIRSATTENSGDISNAIALCFECHAEVHHYNSAHPKGRKFQPTELRKHKEQWLSICRERPEIFVYSQPPPEAGSIERLLNELEFNMALANAGYRSGRLADIQFKRAIADGTFTWISENLKNAIMAAYVAINAANFEIERMLSGPVAITHKTVDQAVKEAKAPIQSAIDALLAEPAT